MPTSAAGSKRRGAWSGFTLIELLVVMAIMALATAGVGLAMRDTGQATLDREAERLAALFESARAQSRASGVAVRWHPTEQGFAFEALEVLAVEEEILWISSLCGQRGELSTCSALC